MRPKHFPYYAFVLLFAACAHPAHKWVRKGIIPEKKYYGISLSRRLTTDSIQILYTGCGGLVIFKGSEGIITDPYYTGHKLWNLGHMKIDPENDAKVIAAINTIDTAKNISTAMISHAHYDHLQDLPYLLDHNLLSDTLKVIGDSSTHCSLQPFLKPSHKTLYADTLAVTQEAGSPVKWTQVSAHMRVLTILSGHAPHYRKIRRMTGNTCYNKRPLAHAEDKSKAKHWLGGKSMSFLIDVMDETNTRPLLRIYLQPSSCEAPQGFVLPEVLEEKPVDVALIGVASSGNVKPYPTALLDHITPEKIILIHWEDFFQDLYKDHPKSIRLTHVNDFLSLLRKHYNYKTIEELQQRVSMPKPLTKISIRY